MTAYFRTIYQALRRFVTLNNSVLLAAGCLVIVGVWNTVGTLQKNYLLQQKVNDLDQQIELARLETETLKLQQQYLKSPEYLELSARKSLDKTAPGEKVIILPVVKKPDEIKNVAQPKPVEKTNYEKWLQFFFGHK